MDRVVVWKWRTNSGHGSVTLTEEPGTGERPATLLEQAEMATLGVLASVHVASPGLHYLWVFHPNGQEYISAVERHPSRPGRMVRWVTLELLGKRLA